MATPLGATAGEGSGITASVIPSFEPGLALVEKVLLALAVLGVGLGFAILLRTALRKWLSPLLPPRIYKPLENTIFYTVLGVAFFASLAPFGIEPTLLLVTGGIAGIVLGFASQTVFSNLLSGLFLYIERPFHVGDHVEVYGRQGVVEDINMFSTVIRMLDGVVVRIPNEKVFSETVSNMAKAAVRRLEYSIGVSYDSDLDAAKRAILEAVDEHPYCLARPAPEVFVEEFASSSIVLRLRCWTPVSVWLETQKTVLEKVKEKLDAYNVVIPYPQLDLHVKSLPSQGSCASLVSEASAAELASC